MATERESIDKSEGAFAVMVQGDEIRITFEDLTAGETKLDIILPEDAALSFAGTIVRCCYTLHSRKSAIDAVMSEAVPNG